MHNVERKTKRPQSWTIIVYSATALLFLFYGSLETSRRVLDELHVLTSIELLNPPIRSFIRWSAFGACLTLLVISCASFKTRWLRWPGIGLLIGLILYPCCLIWHTVKNVAEWTTHGEVTTDDGKTFVFCNSSFMMGQLMAIAEIPNKDKLKLTCRVLVSNNGDWPRSWASVVRPHGAADEYGQLYLKDGMLIGIRYENKCYLAYDLGKNKAYGHGAIELISPFVCLYAGDTPNKVDIERTCEHITKAASFCESSDDIRHAQAFLSGEPIPGCPPTRELRSALATQTEAVASAATLMLGCYDVAYAKLRTRIAVKSSTSDTTEQGAALEENSAALHPR
jgi:hypothetical protein